MENNENFVTEQVAENTEQTAEQTPKTYTEAEFNAKLDEVLGKKIARREAKIRREYDSRYGRLESVVKAGVGVDSLDEATDFLAKAYAEKGRAPKTAAYSAKDIETLARAEADEIIRGGIEDVAEEVDRLADIGMDNLNAREKALFKVLAEHRQNAERSQELAKIGVTEDVYNSQEFKDFRSKFAANTPISDIYDIYKKTQPKKEFQTMGSMKNTTVDTSTVKDFYSYEEAIKFTDKDFDKNPALEAAVRASMAKWNK